jgi:hypothetical protein
LFLEISRGGEVYKLMGRVGNDDSRVSGVGGETAQIAKKLKMGVNEVLVWEKVQDKYTAKII